VQIDHVTSEGGDVGLPVIQIKKSQGRTRSTGIISARTVA
jgi:hypothetical protein